MRGKSEAAAEKRSEGKTLCLEGGGWAPTRGTGRFTEISSRSWGIKKKEKAVWGRRKSHR